MRYSVQFFIITRAPSECRCECKKQLSHIPSQFFRPAVRYKPMAIRAMTGISRVLRVRSEWPCSRAVKQGDELAPLGRRPVGNSFDQLVGADKQRGWHFEAERPRGAEVDHQLKFGGL
jgi:hypothetical protein